MRSSAGQAPDLGRFKDELSRVTKRKLEEFAKSRRELQQRIRDGFHLGPAKDTNPTKGSKPKATKTTHGAPGSPGSNSSEVVQGYRMEPVSQPQQKDRSPSRSPLYLLAAVALIAALGFFLSARKT